jgi:hypothetical protein
VLLTLANLYAIGCSKFLGAQNGIAFAYEREPTGTSGEHLARAYVSLEGDMSYAGMAPVIGQTRELAPGRYLGTLDLNMPGDGVVLFQIKLASGETFDQQVELRNIQAT